MSTHRKARYNSARGKFRGNREDRAITHTPEISVIMGVYNNVDCLCDAIDSVLGQTHRNWELIICDDASTDGSYQIAQEYQKAFPDKIVLLHNEYNIALAASLNRCLEVARGEYIARMDADDISLPQRFELQAAYLREHPDVNAVGSTVYRTFDGEPAGIIGMPEHPTRDVMLTGLPFIHPTLMMRKASYDALGGYISTTRTRRCEDVALFFRFYEHEMRGYNFQEPLLIKADSTQAVMDCTFERRLNGYLELCAGFDLLGIPKWRKAERLAVTLAKAATPKRLIKYLRQPKR